MQIKICGLKYLQNIQEVAKLQPDMIGLIFYPGSPRFLNTSKTNLSSLKKIPPTVKKVGVFVNPPYEEVEEKVDSVGLDYIQLHGNESPTFCARLKEDLPIQLIKALGIDEKMNFEICKSFEPVVDYFLFDTKSPKHGGTGIAYPWEWLSPYPMYSSKPFVLSGGIDISLLKQNISTCNPIPWAIDLSSKLERSVGKKDLYKVEEIISYVRTL
ncbi:MAG: phosphoribosylanthranilate isomerase [Cytophagales bacterium]|nr:phosphoribosylanthranilate isomerase [Cytophagales bacterium]